MEAIRKGNDIFIRWSIFNRDNSNPYPLDGKDLLIIMSSVFGNREVVDFTVSGNTVEFVFYGKEQKHSGVYTLTLVENNGREGMKTVDVCGAFKLVPRTCLADRESKLNVELIRVDLTSQLSVDLSGGGVYDYNELTNKPVINGVEIKGNKSLNDLGIQPEMEPITNQDIHELLN